MIFLSDMTQSLFDWKPSACGERLSSALTNRGWVNARMLMPLTGMTDRQLRSEAEASDGAIVTGNKGYCLLSECGVDDLNHSANRLISQGKKMIRRGIQIKNRAHGRIGK